MPLQPRAIGTGQAPEPRRSSHNLRGPRPSATHASHRLLLYDIPRFHSRRYGHSRLGHQRGRHRAVSPDPRRICLIAPVFALRHTTSHIRPATNACSPKCCLAKSGLEDPRTNLLNILQCHLLKSLHEGWWSRSSCLYRCSPSDASGNNLRQVSVPPVFSCISPT